MTRYKDILFRTAVTLSALCVIGIIVFIFGYVFFMGFQSINIDFLTDRPRGMPLGREGGIFPAIMGTVYLGALSGFMAGGIALATALFLVFYCRNTLLNKIISTSIYFISGIPSILFGVIGHMVLIRALGIPRSLIAASITIAVMIMPFITIRIIKIFREDISDLFSSSLCLGLPKWYIIRALILPKYLVNIAASITLGIAFGVGAAAPVIHTGAVLFADVPRSITRPFMALSNHLHILVSEGISLENAYGTALVLMVLLLAANILCRVWEHFREGEEGRFGKGSR